MFGTFETEEEMEAYMAEVEGENEERRIANGIVRNEIDYAREGNRNVPQNLSNTLISAAQARLRIDINLQSPSRAA